MINPLLLALLLAALMPSAPFQAQTRGHRPPRKVPSHCSAQEKVIFSCSMAKGKVVSLCSSPGLNASSGYLQYRFGAIGSQPELVYPETQEHPKDHFKSGTLMYSGGGGAYLEFNHGEYKYVVFTGIGKGWEREGVVVSKSGKQVALLECQGPWASEIGPDFFDRAGIPPANDEFEIPLPYH
jgi:hypothetical protein